VRAFEVKTAIYSFHRACGIEKDPASHPIGFEKCVRLSLIFTEPIIHFTVTPISHDIPASNKTVSLFRPLDVFATPSRDSPARKRQRKPRKRIAKTIKK
jgi:hypothetical protein